MTASCVAYSHLPLWRQREHPIDCMKSDIIVSRNDHTKIDLDSARLIPTEDLARVEILIFDNESQRDITNYSIGEIEIMVYEKDALGTSHSEVHFIS